ncbi:MazG-like family protein [Streptomyces sp. NPDC058157]|uniref:MazG-like family protein n=1 Tax=Streptomyces sp. NPDC058157 TaxID=3346360 RepID=UPI0036E409DC
MTDQLRGGDGPAEGAGPVARREAVGGAADSVWETVHALAARFEAAAAERGVVAPQSHVIQVLKIGEEFGEAAQAVIGATGSNPRKGRSHSWEDVHDEVCDVIITGMVALARMRPDAAAYFAGQLALKAGRFLPGPAPVPEDDA